MLALLACVACLRCLLALLTLFLLRSAEKSAFWLCASVALRLRFAAAMLLHLIFWLPIVNHAHSLPRRQKIRVCLGLSFVSARSSSSKQASKQASKQTEWDWIPLSSPTTTTVKAYARLQHTHTWFSQSHLAFGYGEEFAVARYSSLVTCHSSAVQREISSTHEKRGSFPLSRFELLSSFVAPFLQQFDQFTIQPLCILAFQHQQHIGTFDAKLDTPATTISQPSPHLITDPLPNSRFPLMPASSLPPSFLTHPIFIAEQAYI